MNMADRTIQEALGGRYDDLGGRTVERVVGDFLSALRAGVMTVLENYGREPQVEWCLAVPTCWSPAARAVFREAVQRAGFETHPGHRVSYISEAKAAATWAAQQLEGRPDIQAGDAIIVCDCGGVTTVHA